MNVVKAFTLSLLKLWQRTGKAPGRYCQAVERWGPGLHPGRPLTARLPNGCRMTCDLRDHVSRFIYFHGLYEPIEAYLFVHLLAPGATVIDAGANIGQYTLLAATGVGPEGSVHSFEPVPDTFNLLSTHVGLNGLTNVRLNRQALWNEAGTVCLGLDGGDDFNAGSYTIGGGQAEAAVTAPAIPLDEYATARRLRRIDLIKMDIEGAEWFALQGMRATLRRDRPTILMELNRQAAQGLGYDTQDVWDFFKGIGYRAWAIGPSSEQSGPIESLPTLGQQNLLFHDKDLPDAIRHGWTLKSILRWARGGDRTSPARGARTA
jgi:FkbM family methyltransferase